MSPITPFKVILTSNSSYLINGGKIINYYNPLNFRKVRKDFNDKIIPKIDRELSVDHVYTIGAGVIRIEIFLFAAFKYPSFWVSSSNFSPIIDNAWIVIREQENDGSFNINGSIVNYKADQIRFDSVPTLQFGYACNLTPIAIIDLEETNFVVKQILNSDYILTRLFDTKSFNVCNNNLEQSIEEDLEIYGQVYSQTNNFFCRGNLETKNLSEEGLTEALVSPAIPTVNGAFLERHPES